MVVCNCFNVRESDLASLAVQGRFCLASVSEVTGLGTNCGKCIPQALSLLRTSPRTGIAAQEAAQAARQIQAAR